MEQGHAGPGIGWAAAAYSNTWGARVETLCPRQPFRTAVCCVQVGHALLERIISEGYSEEYGVRPLRRAVVRCVLACTCVNERAPVPCLSHTSQQLAELLTPGPRFVLHGLNVSN